MTDEELRKEVIKLFSLYPDTIINSGYGMPTPITILDIYKAGRSKALQQLKSAFEAGRQQYVWKEGTCMELRYYQYNTFDDWYALVKGEKE